MDIDFEGSGVGSGAGQGADAGQQSVNADNNLANQLDKTDLSGDGTGDINDSNNGGGGQQQSDNNGNGNGDGDGNKNHDSDGNGDGNQDTTLEAGTEIEFEGQTYTVAENGDIVDKDGNVFKKADEVADWLKQNDASDADDDQPLSIDAIKESVGVDVTDEKGKPVDFTNDAAGVKSYIDSVLALKSNEVAVGAVNKLFADNPVLKQFIDYVRVTGSPKGFGDIPDRSGIKLDKDNPSQLEAIIRMAAQEFGNKSLNDSYIKYLKDSGALYDEAKTQLEALVGKDKAYKKEIETRAQAIREQEEQDVRNYWQSVSDAIAKRVIGGYKIPDSFVKEVNGQKITYTPDDFYRYLSEPAGEDEDGNVLTAYQRDLNKISNDDTLAKDLLDAWLMFTGGSYKDLIDMKVKEDTVRKLVIKSKQQRSNPSVRITPKKKEKVDANDILFG